MRVLVTGAGRSGTNWATEIVRGTGKFRFTKQIEDRNFFRRWRLPRYYGTKLATENIGFTWENLKSKIQKYDDLMVIFITRHPIDNCLSKIKRGQPNYKGGDASSELAPDATTYGAISALGHTYHIFQNLTKDYPERTFHIKLENLISDTEKEVLRICHFIKCKPTKKALEAFKHNRNKFQKARYGNDIDISQIDMYKRWPEIYDGFFGNKESDIIEIKRAVARISFDLGYDIK